MNLSCGLPCPYLSTSFSSVMHMFASSIQLHWRFGLPACVTSCLHMQFYGTLCKKSFHRISNFGFENIEHRRKRKKDLMVRSFDQIIINNQSISFNKSSSVYSPFRILDIPWYFLMAAISTAGLQNTTLQIYMT